jgi:hypothetical protein
MADDIYGLPYFLTLPALIVAGLPGSQSSN